MGESCVTLVTLKDIEACYELALAKLVLAYHAPRLLQSACNFKTSSFVAFRVSKLLGLLSSYMQAPMLWECTWRWLVGAGLIGR